MKKIIAITGGTGSMGKETVKAFMQLPDDFSVLIMVPHNIKEATRYKKTYGGRVSYFTGDVRKIEDCKRLVANADYVLHMAALIPPKADHDAKSTLEINVGGTQNMVNAVKEVGKNTGKEPKFIYISTVAVYGSRTFGQRWGRVGDPLLPSVFDAYGASKIAAERYLLDAELKNFVILRQTAVLYDNLLTNNIKDGLMFHTTWNCAIEWVTAKDSGILLKKIVQTDFIGETGDFWNKVYNIGGGETTRQTGYETFDDGFKIIGGSAKKFFKPNWNLPRNFHCFWFTDSDILEEKFNFRSQSTADFWKWYKSRHRLYGLAKILPLSLIRGLVVKPLLKNNNAPQFWVKSGDKARIQAYFGGKEEYDKIPTEWQNYELQCEKEEYPALKSLKNAFFLDHGYDESKPDDELDINDMRAAAKFRGGECLSEKMEKGDLYTKLKWKCAEGHEFTASPYTVLKAGHWCNECCYPHKDLTWRFDVLARKNSFFGQVWWDSHDKSENFVYTLKNGKAELNGGNYDGNERE